MIKIGAHPGHLLPRGLKVQWSMTWENIGVLLCSDMPAEVDLLHMRIERHAGKSPGTGEFPAQMASNAEMFPIDDAIMYSQIIQQVNAY